MVDHNGEFVAAGRAGLMLMLICCSQASRSSLSNVEVFTWTGNGICPESEGFYKPRNSGQCFKFYAEPDRTWSEAKAWCVSQGMALAKPEGPILKELGQYLEDALCPSDDMLCEVTFVWLGGRYDSDPVRNVFGFVWDHDNSKLSNTYPYWADGEPRGDLNDYCLAMNPGESRPYYSTPCSAKWPTLCEGSGGCPESEGFYKPRNSGQCFKLYKDTYRSWSAAKAWCVSQGMALAKPEGPIVQELGQYLDDALCPSDAGLCEDDSVWLGGRYDSDPVRYVFGFVWDHDNSKLSKTYPYWADGEPRGDMNDYCLQMNPGESRPYYSTPCSAKWPTLCEGYPSAQLDDWLKSFLIN